MWGGAEKLVPILHFSILRWCIWYLYNNFWRFGRLRLYFTWLDRRWRSELFLKDQKLFDLKKKKKSRKTREGRERERRQGSKAESSVTSLPLTIWLQFLLHCEPSTLTSHTQADNIRHSAFTDVRNHVSPGPVKRTMRYTVLVSGK